MGNAPHKRSPPDDLIEEDISDTFRKEARAALEHNDSGNRLRGLKYGQPGYKISNQAELADAIPTSRRMVGRILGPVREGTQADLVDRSVFVGRIRELLELQPITRIPVRVSRAKILQFLNDLSDEDFRVFEEEYRRLSKR